MESIDPVDPISSFKPVNFKFKGSRMNIERLSCRFNDPYVECGVIHTSHLITWVKFGVAPNPDNSLAITNYTSKTFQNHPLWKPINLEITEGYFAVEAQATSKDQLPKILLYNVKGSQYVWYSISLKDSAVSNVEYLSFILAISNGNATIIVANKKQTANYLMYYQSRPMVLSISQYLSTAQLQACTLQIASDSSLKSVIPLSNLLSVDQRISALIYHYQLFFVSFAIVAALLFFVIIYDKCHKNKSMNEITEDDVTLYNTFKS